MKAYAREKPHIVLEDKVLFNHNMRSVMRKWFRAEKKQGRQYLRRLTEGELHEVEQDAEEIEGNAEASE